MDQPRLLDDISWWKEDVRQPVILALLDGCNPPELLYAFTVIFLCTRH